MAENIKKYLGAEGVEQLIASTRAETLAGDNKTLADAKLYSDDLADNYDAAGTAATKMQELADGQVKTNTDAIAALDERVEGVEADVETLVGSDVGKSARTIANEELAKQLIAEGAAESLDTLAEIASWIQDHPDDAAAMSRAIDDLEALVGTLPEGVTATTIVGYIQEAVAAEKDRAESVEEGFDARLRTVEGQLGVGGESVYTQIQDAKNEAIEAAASDATAKADKALEDAKAYADGLDDAMNTRMEEVEGTAHEHANKTVLDGITAEKVSEWDSAEDDAIAAAATDATTKANKALEDAKTYTDGVNTSMNVRVTELEGKSHVHDNMDLLNTYTQSNADLADAVAKKHEHTNKAVLDNITSTNVTNWNAAEANAKAYADDQRTAAVSTASADATAKANKALDDAKAYADQAEADANSYADGLNTAMNTRVEALEGVTYTEITAAEVEAMFGA